MFDFEKLDAYQVVKQLNTKVLLFISKSSDIDPYLIDQWKRATLSMMLNLAEGTGRMTKNDKRHFYTIARGSVFESVAILDMLLSLDKVDEKTFEEFYLGYEQVSKMLLAMYRSMSE